MDQMAIPDAAHKREPYKDPKRFSKAPRCTHIDYSSTKTFRVLSCFSQNKHVQIYTPFFIIVCIRQLSSRKWTAITNISGSTIALI